MAESSGQGPPPKNKKYLTWSKARRFEAGAKLVVYEGWTHLEASKEVGVSRPRLTIHVAELRKKNDGRVARAKIEILGDAISQAAAGPLGLQEQRRVGTFKEFSDRYWSNWFCPDCGKHHEDPDFHLEIMDVIENPELLRTLINMPPYHSKSTIITVKNTVYRIAKNPNFRRIIISKSLDFAKTFLHSIDQLLVNPEIYAGGPNLIEDWGPFKNDGGSTVWNTEHIYVAGRVTPEKDPTVQVLGAGGQVYGRRADDIVSDDVATLENQSSPARVSKLLEWYDKEVLSRIGTKGRKLWVGTRVNPGDIYSFLGKRVGYKVLRYPLILDDATERTLWPDHFNYDAAIVKRTEMSPRDFQLVYQNQDSPGEMASFTPETIDPCKNVDRPTGHYESRWRLVAGIDLAGGTKDSGYTAGILVGVDLATGKRFLVDAFNNKSMRSPQLKEQMLKWADQYNIYAYRVESNGLQGQIIQYDTEIIRALSLKGTRVEPHKTGSNKWDPQFGVESMSPLWSAQMYDMPWANPTTIRLWEQLYEQLILFPMGQYTDMVMALWFAELGIRDLLKRTHLPQFDSRFRVPERLKRKRHIVNFSDQTVEQVPMHAQTGSAMRSSSVRSYRRLMVGRPGDQAIVDPEPSLPPQYANVQGSPFDEEHVG